MPRHSSLSLLLFCLPLSLSADDAPPRSLDDRLEITLFAEHPLLNTPTGIDVDARGRVWVIESNTHFPPAGYDGHPSDRLLILTDSDGDGRAEAKVFADGFTHSMSVAVRPVWLDPVSFSAEEDKTTLAKRTQVFLATRKEILLLEDTDGDDVCDKQTRLVHLDTEGSYPHNGLAGFAFDALGNMFFGFGENLGADYKIIGRDGVTYSGGGEGGNIYQVQPDGTKLKHWATGFWNPHANCVDAFGNLFSVDNDPDSLPPCRLLHIIEGGDYGYRFRNGRKGMHPFTAWNGEIPGTLPMVAGTGEAPSGILAYEHDAFPEEYLGNLIVTSWGDHRIDRFVLKNKGASFESVAEPFIVGGENFRPVGIALAPDGSLYLSDWVLRDYKLHKQGRVWRIRAKNAPPATADQPPTLEAQLESLALPVRRLAARRLARTRLEVLKSLLQRRAADGLDAAADRNPSTRTVIECLWAWNELIGERQADVGDGDPNAYFLLARLGSPPRPLDEVDTAAQWLLPNRVHPLHAAPMAATPSPVPPLELSDMARQRGDGRPMERPLGDSRFLLAAIDDLILSELFAAQFYLDTADPFVYAMVIRRAAIDLAEHHVIWPADEVYSGRVRAGWLLANRRRFPRDAARLPVMLRDSDVTVNRLAVQWIAEEKLTDLRPQVEAVFNSESLTPDLFLATLAALEMLDGKNPQDFDKTPPGKHVLPILKDKSKPANVRAIALRLVDPFDPELDPMLVRELMKSDDPKLRREAIRTAAMNPQGTDYCGLLVVVHNEELDVNLRAEALVGIARRTDVSISARDFVKKFSKDDNATLAREAQRALRKDSTERPTEPDAPADLEAGRRLFYHPNGPKCFQCHTVQGRGGKIGPDLTTIGRAMSREKLIESIREPSREVAPQFTNWTMLGTDGKTYAGMIVHENEGTTVLGTPEGNLITLKTADVEERLPQKTSVMPDKLEQRMTEREFRDLVAFLESLK